MSLLLSLISDKKNLRLQLQQQQQQNITNYYNYTISGGATQQLNKIIMNSICGCNFSSQEIS